ncbi:MAG: pyruvate decarboxylase [Cloacibacterium sp.]|nr:pyruvate decarboxylase [Cloacibacterium sp.]
MKKNILFGILVAVVLVSCAGFGQKLVYFNQNLKLEKINKVVYFQPDIFPEIEEIKSPTYQTFFSAVTDQMKMYGGLKTIQMDSSMSYDSIDVESLKEICKNNEAEVAVVPKIKYFKVGIGKYVFSNQVLVQLKLYDNHGNFLMETQYDTYKGNARLTGTAENSIKIGTQGAMKKMKQELRNKQIINKGFEN